MEGTNTWAELESVNQAYEDCRKQFYIMQTILQNSMIAAQQPIHPLTSTQMAQEVHGRESYVKVPPCDTEVFDGSYETLPSFRDMFTAVYANHPKLSLVEKLFHLRKKTSGWANAIVCSYTLSGDNFELAWEALKNRYENKRVLVDKQIASLFNIKAVVEGNSDGIKKFKQQ